MEELEFLHQLGLSLARGKDLFTTLLTLQSEILRLIDADALFVAFYDQATDMVEYPIFFEKTNPREHPSRTLGDNPGLTGAVIYGGKTLYLKNMMSRNVQDHYAPVDENDLVLHTFLGIPLVANDKIIGMLSVQSRNVDAYSKDQIQLMENVAIEAALAIDKTRLLDQLGTELGERQRVEEMSLLYQLGLTLTSGQDLYQALRAFVKELKNIMTVDAFHVGLYDAQTDLFTYSLFLNLEDDLQLPPRKLRENPGLTSEVIASGRTLYLPDVTDPQTQRAHTIVVVVEAGIRSYVGIPLMLEGRVIGVMSVQSREPGAYNADHLRLLETLAAQVAITLEKARLLERLQKELDEREHIEHDRENLIHQLRIQNKESETLRESLAGIVGMLEFSQIIETILDQIKRVVPYDSASIWRVEDRVQKFIAGRNVPPPLEAGEMVFPIDDKNSAFPILSGTLPYILKLDVQEELKDFQHEPHTYVQSWLAIPLKTRGQILGVIALDGKEKNQFTQHHAELAVTFANQVAIAPDNSQLFSGLQSELAERTRVEHALREGEQRYRLLYEMAGKQTKELALIGRVRNAMAQELDLSGLIYNVVESIAESLGYTQVSLYLKQNDALVLQHQVGYQTPYKTIALNEGVIGTVAGTGKVAYLEDVTTNPIYRQAVEGVVSEICIPLFDKRHLVGVLNVESTQGVKLTEADLNLLITLCEHIGIALENSRLFSELQSELLERTHAEISLRQRESMLEAVTFAAERFLTSTNWREVIGVVLERLGKAMNATHAYLFENSTTSDGVEVSTLFGEWTDPGYPTAIDFAIYENPHVIRVTPGSTNEFLQRGESYAGNEHTFPAVDKPRFEAVGIKALAEVPLMVDGRWWGTIGFDAFDEARDWSHFEVDTLRIAANLLSTAIRRQQDEQALQIELLERKQIEHSLRQRESILEVVTEAANLFLKSADWRDEIDVILEKLGTIINASHAFVFENHDLEDGNVVSSMQFEWTAQSVPSDLDDPIYQNMPVRENDFETWYEVMIKGQPYIGDSKHLNRDEMDFLLNRGMKALLDVPIYVDGKWWGTIGFDDMKTEREWTNAEVGALLVAGNILGAAIQRQNADARVKEELSQRKQAELNLRERESMLEAMADAANRFLKAPDWRSEIDAVLERLGKTLNSSHAYLFEKHSREDGVILNSMRYEWTAPGQKPDKDNPNYQNAPVHESGFERYYAILDSGEPFVGSSSFYTGSEKELMKESGIKALLEMRLIVNGRQWGAIGFDEKERDREWTPLEVDVIRVSANVLGAAIKRQMDETALQNELTQRRKLIDELESKNAELERFTYTVSHDLKSPLFTIRGFLGYLEQDAVSGDQERLRNDIQRIVDATDKMQQLLNDLLELSRIGRLMNEPREIDLNQLLSEVTGLLHGQIKQSRAELRIQKNLPTVIGDRQRISEVIQNLLDNAAKFMGDQPQPCIEVGEAGKENDMSVLFVRDNGIGIQEEHIERVFGLFNKLDPKSDGTGIGLALVRRIVEVHGGRIWVESEIGTGSTFYFTLPSRPAPDSVI